MSGCLVSQASSLSLVFRTADNSITIAKIIARMKMLGWRFCEKTAPFSAAAIAAPAARVTIGDE